MGAVLSLVPHTSGVRGSIPASALCVYVLATCDGLAVQVVPQSESLWKGSRFPGWMEKGNIDYSLAVS